MEKSLEIKEDELWCEYSDLPSPKAYVNCTDYDSMGNHGRFPNLKNKKLNQRRWFKFFVKK